MTLDSISDKEKLVMKLLKEDKNYPEIAKEAHVSFTFISKLNKKRLRENNSVKKQLSIPTQALKLFSEGESVLNVTIILDRPPQEILEYYDCYLQLIGLDEIASLVDFNHEYLSTITKLINYVIQNSVSTNDILTTFELVKDLPRLKSMEKQLKNKIKALRQEKDYLSEEYNNSSN